MVLKSRPSFLPRVISSFYHNKDIFLPFLYPALKLTNISLHSLDVVRAVGVYLAATSSFKKNDSFCVLPERPKKGHSVSSTTIDVWLKQLFSRAFTLHCKAFTGHQLVFCCPVLYTKIWNLKVNQNSHFFGPGIVVGKCS